MTKLLMDDNYVKAFGQLVDDVTSIDFEKLKCMSGNDKDKICMAYNMYLQTGGPQQLDNMIAILDKYTAPLQKTTNWLNSTSSDYFKYCGGNTEQLDKLKQVINKINIITNNVPSSQPSKGLSGGVIAIIVIVIILVIAAIGGGIYYYKTREQ